MQMVEYMEECVLRFTQTGKFLYVVNDQDIYTLIECDKIIDGIMTYRVCILHLKKVRRKIQHPFLRVQFLYFSTDGINQMRFSHTRRSINK